MINILSQYKKIEIPIRNVIAAEFFVQTVNATFMNILPLYMIKEGYSTPTIALFITLRFIGVFTLALPLGHFIKGRPLLPLFYLSTFFVPFFGILTIICLGLKFEVASAIALLLWGASFTFIQIPVFPYILRNADKEHQTAAISLSYSTWSFGGILSGCLIALLDYIDRDLFDERFILLFFSASGFLGLIFLFRIRGFKEQVNIDEKIRNLNSIRTGKTQWGLVLKALIPTLIIAIGAGLTIPFISMFFENVHNLHKGNFSILSFIASLFVAWLALLVPWIKEKVGYKIAIPATQSLAVMSLVALATTDFYNQYGIAVIIAAICYIVRQPLMNMAGPMTSELVLNYVGKRNREITSALTSAIWSGSWVFSGFMVTVLLGYQISFANIFLITALLYAFGILLYYLLIIDYEKKEKAGIIEK